MERILNKISEIFFFVGYIVWHADYFKFHAHQNIDKIQCQNFKTVCNLVAKPEFLVVVTMVRITKCCPKV